MAASGGEEVKFFLQVLNGFGTRNVAFWRFRLAFFVALLVFVFLEPEVLMVEAGEGKEECVEVLRVGGGEGAVGVKIEIAELAEDAGGAEVEGGLLEFGVVLPVVDVAGEFAEAGEVTEGILGVNPIDKAGVFPGGDVAFGDFGMALSGEPLGDGLVRGAVVKQAVDLVAELAREARDFADFTAHIFPFCAGCLHRAKIADGWTVSMEFMNRHEINLY
jgi:hypothetical protein